MGNGKHTHTHKIPKHILKKRENPPRERERERLCWKSGLNGRNDIKFIQNKIWRRRVKI